MLASEFADRNPKAVVESLEESIRFTWRGMHRERKQRSKCDVQGWSYKWHNDWAKRYHHILEVLLAIRKGY
jgi:hypothetical protein